MSAWIEISGATPKCLANAVALYMSAWIEINSSPEWNASTSSHSTWVRGLKCTCCSISNKFDIVALYMSAWIEISGSFEFAFTVIRRTLHECVDWNFIHKLRFKARNKSHSTWVRGLKFLMKWKQQTITPVALYMSAWIEIFNPKAIIEEKIRRTLHECVDWNKKFAPIFIQIIESHSTWVRGLKYIVCVNEQLRFRRTLHECVDWNLPT